jgi:hypothetical protein
VCQLQTRRRGRALPDAAPFALIYTWAGHRHRNDLSRPYGLSFSAPVGDPCSPLASRRRALRTTLIMSPSIAPSDRHDTGERQRVCRFWSSSSFCVLSVRINVSRAACDGTAWHCSVSSAALQGNASQSRDDASRALLEASASPQQDCQPLKRPRITHAFSPHFSHLALPGVPGNVTWDCRRCDISSLSYPHAQSLPSLIDIFSALCCSSCAALDALFVSYRRMPNLLILPSRMHKRVSQRASPAVFTRSLRIAGCGGTKE